MGLVSLFPLLQHQHGLPTEQAPSIPWGKAPLLEGPVWDKHWELPNSAPDQRNGRMTVCCWPPAPSAPHPGTSVCPPRQLHSLNVPVWLCCGRDSSLLQHHYRMTTLSPSTPNSAFNPTSKQGFSLSPSDTSYRMQLLISLSSDSHTNQHARVSGWNTFIHMNAQILAHPACCSCSHLLDSMNKEGFLHK